MREGASVTMSKFFSRIFFGCLLFSICGLPVVTAIQSQAPSDPKSDAEKSSRKLKSGQPPEWPELARQMNIRGMARVMVTITPDGVVKDVKEVGGHPLLIDALIRAVKKWKYEPAAKETVLIVKAEFGQT